MRHTRFFEKVSAFFIKRKIEFADDINHDDDGFHDCCHAGYPDPINQSI
jgi:hypothetical protein